MKQRLIVLFDASLGYADTAPIDSQLGLSIPNIGNFIIRLVISSTIGAFLGWVIFKLIKMIRQK